MSEQFKRSGLSAAESVRLAVEQLDGVRDFLGEASATLLRDPSPRLRKLAIQAGLARGYVAAVQERLHGGSERPVRDPDLLFSRIAGRFHRTNADTNFPRKLSSAQPKARARIVKTRKEQA